jgi:hypothetical protein
MAAESNRAFPGALERLSQALHRRGLHHFLIGGLADAFDTRTAGVRVCGRRLGNILADEPDLRRNMVEFLAAQAGSALSPSPLQRALMTVLPGGTPSAGVLLRELLRGIGESAGDRDR